MPQAKFYSPCTEYGHRALHQLSLSCDGMMTFSLKFKPGPVVLWGADHDRINDCIKRQRDYFCVDFPFFDQYRMEKEKLIPGKPGHAFFRITRNSQHQPGDGVYPSDRWDALKIPLAPWRTRGQHIVVTPRGWAAGYHKKELAEAWVADVLEQLKGHTLRTIKIKTKEQQYPLAAVLDNAWALVADTSMTAVQAAIAGIPVFVSQQSAAADVGNYHLNLIENPLMGEREMWLHALAYSQFSWEEMGNGVAWEIINRPQEHQL
jgi:hypothetical protein